MRAHTVQFPPSSSCSGHDAMGTWCHPLLRASFELQPQGCMLQLLVCHQHLANHAAGAPQPAPLRDEQVGGGDVNEEKAISVMPSRGTTQQASCCLRASPRGWSSLPAVHGGAMMAPNCSIRRRPSTRLGSR
eukprot:365345-Chlamydomonas_euryale.AAC.8